MTDQVSAQISRLFREQFREILAEWTEEQLRVSRHTGGMAANELQAQCAEFLKILDEAFSSGSMTGTGGAWQPVRDFLAGISRSRAMQGFSPTDPATFVFSLKSVLFRRLGALSGINPELATRVLIEMSEVFDALGLYTTEVYQKGRDEIIRRQQQDMLELSTPVVKLWDGILALPMIGTLDSQRTQVVMETLLQRIVETGAEVAIIDITGVPTVDTLTAQHLLKTVTAARLMGAECIISGIRPQIAQTIVHLGVELGGVTTKATLADAFRVALVKTGAGLAPRSAGNGTVAGPVGTAPRPA